MRLPVQIILFSTTMAAVTLPPMTANSESIEETKVVGETIYVPAYSHINSHTKVRQPLASTIVIHNVDPVGTISLQSVEYYDQEGTLLNSFLTEPITLDPYASASFLTEINDNKGGIGANYLIVWTSTGSVLSPISQAVMVGGTGSQGISFLTEGRVIDRTAF